MVDEEPLHTQPPKAPDQTISKANVRYEVVVRNGACISIPVEEEREPEPNTIQFTQSGHVNFFANLENGQQIEGTGNKEYETEKKKEQEDYEKQIGLLTYLGQGSRECTGEVPWYEKPSMLKSLPKQDVNDKKLEKSKQLDDPLRVIQRFLGPTSGPSKIKSEKKTSGNFNISTLPAVTIKAEAIEHKAKKNKKEKKKRKKNKKDKHEKKSRKRKRSASSSEDSDTSKKVSSLKRKRHSSSSSDSVDSEAERKEKLAILRVKRLAREKEEKAKARKLLGLDKVEELSSNEKDTSEVKVVQQKYHSQYFPETARQNKPLESGTKYWLQ